jgi:hypothetical protein
MRIYPPVRGRVPFFKALFFGSSLTCCEYSGQKEGKSILGSRGEKTTVLHTAALAD